ncbi:MAG TPA: hypothetical protein P5228_06850 [Bacteroidales bacterium]|nr:hypothetical protein [Bacteroidales bacterium]HRZ49555.1 hypothetical protein [Bacteroidales bacterium]
MKKFSSNPLPSKECLSSLTDWCSDFRNIITLLPDQVSNRTADRDSCAFSIPGMADLALHYAERNPGGLIRMVPDKSPFPFELRIEISEAGTPEGSARVQTFLEADLNPMLAMLAGRPLQHLVDEINRKLAGLSIHQPG